MRRGGGDGEFELNSLPFKHGVRLFASVLVAAAASISHVHLCGDSNFNSRSPSVN